MRFQPPRQRDDFEIAIVCALKVEFDAICLVVDEFWDENGDSYGKARGDLNSYRTGRIGKHNVVLLQLRQIGKAHAAAAAASLRLSFNKLRIVLLVGGCAAIPDSKSADTDIMLGDVIIGTAVVQYDLGRKLPDKFLRKDTVGNNLSKPPKEIGNVLALLQTSNRQRTMGDRTAELLSGLQEHARRHGYGSKYEYPGVLEDKLFNADYRHRHAHRECHECDGLGSSVCIDAMKSSCEELGCEATELVTNRKRLNQKIRLCQKGDISHQNPGIFFGAIGSGDTVMKSGNDRDELAKKEGVIAFEMEAAGLWDEVPSLVVKGVFDYGDSHKNKLWHGFASATAACAAKSIIESLPQTSASRLSADISSMHRIENNCAIRSSQENHIRNATAGPNAMGNIIANLAMDGSIQSNIIHYSSFWNLISRVWNLMW